MLLRIYKAVGYMLPIDRVCQVCHSTMLKKNQKYVVYGKNPGYTKHWKCLSRKEKAEILKEVEEEEGESVHVVC